MAYRGERIGLLLPFVAATHNLDAKAFAESVLEKAGLSEIGCWCRFDCATWLHDGNRTRRVIGGFSFYPAGAEPISELVKRHTDWLTGYLVRNQREDGTLYSTYEPFQNRIYEGLSIPRLAHAAWVMARGAARIEDAGLVTSARKITAYLTQHIHRNGEEVWLETGEPSSVSELSFLLLALCSFPEDEGLAIASLANTLWSRIERPHGRICTHREIS